MTSEQKKAAWYRDLPTIFRRKVGYYDFRSSNYSAAFRKYADLTQRQKRQLSTRTNLEKSGLAVKLSGGLGDVVQFRRFTKVMYERGVNVIVKIKEK